MTKPVTESAASDTIKVPAANKSQMLGAALAKLAGLSIEDLSHYLNDTLAQVGDDHYSQATAGHDQANQASLNMKPSAAMKESVKADLSSILGDGDDLSEEIKTKTAELFEAAVDAHLIVEREELIEEMNERLEEAYTELQEEMATKLDTYLDYVVESWMKENEVAIESALRNEVMEDFISGLKNLFAEHYMELPEEKVEVVEGLAEKVIDLEARLDETLTENASLKAEKLEDEKNDVINSVCEGLALTQAEKLRSLCESVEFNGDLSSYETKVTLVKESLLSKAATSAPKTGILTEESDPDVARGNYTPHATLPPEVRRYADAISRSVRK